jgi:membrane-associated protein
VAWVALFVWSGYFFGRIPAVAENLTFVLIAVVVITTIPIVVEYLRTRGAGGKPAAGESGPE